MSLQKNFNLRVKAHGDGSPSDDQLALINGFALKELSADDVYVRTYYAGHNGIDRDREVFDDALLSDFASTLVGKGLFVRHPGGWDGDSGPGEGKIFSAAVIDVSIDEARTMLREPNLKFPPGTERAKILEVSAYILRLDNEESKTLIAKIDGGVAGFVSLGFSASRREPIEDGTGSFIAQRLMSPGEGYELSLVWLGAQPGARAAKAAKHRVKPSEDDDVDLKEALDKVKSLQGKVTDLEIISKAYENLKTVIGELLDDPVELKRLIDEAQAHHEKTVTAVLSQKALLGMIADTDEAKASAKQFYIKMPVAMLEQELKALQEKIPAGGQLNGGDPNAGGNPGEPQVGEKSMTNPLFNPALFGSESAA